MWRIGADSDRRRSAVASQLQCSRRADRRAKLSLSFSEGHPMRVAGVQMDVTLGQPDANLQAMLATLKETAAAGATLTVFPECALTGYCFDSVAEALPF